MSTLPTITAIIPTYKRPILLKRAIESVLKQTYPHFKVCIYDNASGDETEEVVRTLMEQDPRIMYHKHEKNIGMMQNYNYGLSLVNTPFFSFLSDDDMILPWFFETALNGFQQHPDIAFSACNVLIINEKGQNLGNHLDPWGREGYLTSLEAVTEMLKSFKFPNPNAVLFQYEKVKDIDLDCSNEMQLMWDPDYMLQIAARFSIVVTKKTCGIFLAHSDGFSSSFYTQIRESSHGFQIYMKALTKIMGRVDDNPKIENFIKQTTHDLLLIGIRKEIGWFMRSYILSKKFSEAEQSAKILDDYFGTSSHVVFLLNLSKLCQFRPFGLLFFTFVTPLRNFVRGLKKIKRYLTTIKNKNPNFDDYLKGIQ